MSTITFDSREAVAELMAVGVSLEQANAFVKAITKAQAELVTRDILQQELAPIRQDLAVLKWMMGIIVAGILALIMKAFFL